MRGTFMAGKTMKVPLMTVQSWQPSSVGIGYFGS